MRQALKVLACGACLLQAAPLAAQTEQQLRQAFEGHYVVVRMEMPATHLGVDVHPDREPSVDLSSYSSRLREYGVSLREGARVLVTAVRVKKNRVSRAGVWPFFRVPDYGRITASR